jgi:hypothetical protein
MPGHSANTAAGALLTEPVAICFHGLHVNQETGCPRFRAHSAKQIMLSRNESVTTKKKNSKDKIEILYFPFFTCQY